jgi:DNA-binding CsgD family transcriptional regulator
VVGAAFSEPGHIVVVSGEAGIGKTSLLATEKPAASNAIVEGCCLRLAREPLPLAALEQLFESCGGWPDVVGGSDTYRSSEQRLRSVRLWADALTPTGANPPTTVVVEDLQWADETTCEFLVYLASTAPRRRLSVIVTMRDDEAPLCPRAAQVGTDLARLPSATLLRLQRLDREEARALVAALPGELAQDVGRLNSLYERSQGNPYLLTELVKDPPGDVLGDLLLGRFHGLEEDATDLVRLAAVFGVSVSEDLLNRASSLTAERYAAGLRQAADLGVISVAGVGYAFRHSLTREAVLSELLPIEQRMLHARAAAALACEPASNTAAHAVTSAAASLHWRAAGVRDQAAEWSLRAARLARRLDAFTESWGHYQRVLELAEHLAEAPERLSLALEAADVAHLAGDPFAAAAVLESALDAESGGDPARLVALERMGCFFWEAGSPENSLASYRKALSALGPDESAIHARVWGAMARGSLIMAEFDAAQNWAKQAGRAARRFESTEVLADALTTLGTAKVIRGDATGLDELNEGVRLARGVEDRAVLCRSYSNLILVCEFTGRLEEACQAGFDGLRLLPEYGLELPVGATLACNATEVLLRRGDYDRCEQVLAELLDGRIIRGQGLHLYVQRAELLLTRGDLAGARASLSAAAPLAEVDEPPAIGALATVTAAVLAIEGDRDGCFRTVAEALQRLEGTEDEHIRASLLTMGLRNEADERATVPHGHAFSTERTDWLATKLAALGVPAEADVNHAAELRAAGNELTRARGSATAEEWAAAVALWRTAARPREEAYCLLRQAECHLARRQRTEAAAAATASWEVADRLRAAPLAADIKAFMLRNRLPAATRTAPAEERPYGLTSREYEVMRLLATGATNRQIGRTLFISDRTVGIHVSHILQKLHVANRVEAAAAAARMSAT